MYNSQGGQSIPWSDLHYSAMQSTPKRPAWLRAWTRPLGRTSAVEAVEHAAVKQVPALSLECESYTM
jgi:hypothetical protein